MDLDAIDQSRYNVSDLDNDVAAMEEFVRNDERSWVTIILKDPTSALEKKRKSEREVNGTYERENKGKKRERKEKKKKKMKKMKRQKERERRGVEIGERKSERIEEIK